LVKLTQIKNNGNLEVALPEFLKFLQSKLANYMENFDPKISLKIKELPTYVLYSNLKPWSRFGKLLVASKFRLDYAADWSRKGKYLTDIDDIKTILESIKMRIG